MKLEASKLLIVGIFACALGAAAFAVWFRAQQGRRALELWGQASAHRIRNAQEVELRYYAPPLASAELAAPLVAPTASIDVSQVADLIHIRRVFLDDVHILWDASPDDTCAPQWEYALVFRDAQGTTTVWVDAACYHVQMAESGVEANFNPPVLRSVIKFFEHQLARTRPAQRAA